MARKPTKVFFEEPAINVPDTEAPVEVEVAAPVFTEVATTAPAVEEVQVQTDLITVVSRSYLVDPFQRIVFHEGVATPTRRTSWVDSQIAAKILSVVEA